MAPLSYLLHQDDYQDDFEGGGIYPDFEGDRTPSNCCCALSHFSGSDLTGRNHPYDDLWKHNDVTCTILSRHPSIFGGVLVYVWTTFVPRMAF